VIAGWDRADELTAFSVGRIPLPGRPYESFCVTSSCAGGTAEQGPLHGLRVGVLREYMDTRIFGPVRLLARVPSREPSIFVVSC
jgi:hypothetical protein